MFCEPRLCVLEKNSSADEFGFNLVGKNDNVKGIGWIGKIDPNSIAEIAGLHEGDKLISVNGRDITGLNHHQVVAEIKSNPLVARLLVLDANAADSPMTIDKQLIKAESSEVNDSGLSGMDESIKVEFEEIEKIPTNTEAIEVTTTLPEMVAIDCVDTCPVPILTLSLDESLPTVQQNAVLKLTTDESGLEKNEDAVDVADEKSSADELNFNMSAAEMKAKLMANRRVDSRKFPQIPIRQKIEILKSL